MLIFYSFDIQLSIELFLIFLNKTLLLNKLVFFSMFLPWIFFILCNLKKPKWVNVFKIYSKDRKELYFFIKPHTISVKIVSRSFILDYFSKYFLVNITYFDGDLRHIMVSQGLHEIQNHIQHLHIYVFLSIYMCINIFSNTAY